MRNNFLKFNNDGPLNIDIIYSYRSNIIYTVNIFYTINNSSNTIFLKNKIKVLQKWILIIFLFIVNI